MTQAQEQRAALAAKHEMPADGARLLPFPAQLRAAESVDWHGELRHELVGIASTVEQPYRMFDMFGEYEEVIDRAAFNETLSADPDVAFLVNHKGVTMARSRPNARGHRSLELGMVATGLASRAYVNPARQDVKDLVHAVRDGDISEMSFAFRIDDGDWNDDYTEFRIRKVNIDRGDVSAVNYGANPYTSIGARSVELMADLDRLPAGTARAALERLQARAELKPEIIDLAARTAGRIRGEHGPELLTDLGSMPIRKVWDAEVDGGPWHRMQPGTEIWARTGINDKPVLLGRVDAAEQDDAPGGPVKIRTSPKTSSDEAAPVLAPSSLLPPVKGVKADERADLGRSLHLVRLQWQIEGEDD